MEGKSMQYQGDESELPGGDGGTLPNIFSCQGIV